MGGPQLRIDVAGQHIYVSPVGAYQMHAFEPNGTPAWAMRVAGSPPPLTDLSKSTLVRLAKSLSETITESDFEWPEFDEAIGIMLTDGHGRLYVVPKTATEDERPDRLPVDVYSPDGERVASSYLPVQWTEDPVVFTRPWRTAAGDHVYGTKITDDGERVAVRYRLVVTEH